MRVWTRRNGRRGLGAQREVVWKCPPEERLCLWAKGSFTVLPKVGVSVNALLEVNTWVDLSVFNSSGKKWLDLKQQGSMCVWQPQNISWQDDMAGYEAEVKAKVKAKEDAEADVKAKKQRLRSMPWKAKKEEDAETKAKVEEEITTIYQDEWWKKQKLGSKRPGCQRPWKARLSEAMESQEARLSEAKANAKLQLEGPLVHHCPPVRATHIGASNWRLLSASPASAATASAAPPSAASAAAASPASAAAASTWSERRLEISSRMHEQHSQWLARQTANAQLAITAVHIRAVHAHRALHYHHVQAPANAAD